MKDHYGCPVQASINVLSGKWKVQILWHLSFGPRRFAQLHKKLPKISEKVLTEQLRQLQSDGVLARQVTASVPPRVTYSLNSEGEKLVPLMESLCSCFATGRFTSHSSAVWRASELQRCCAPAQLALRTARRQARHHRGRQKTGYCVPPSCLSFPSALS